MTPRAVSARGDANPSTLTHAMIDDRLNANVNASSLLQLLLALSRQRRAVALLLASAWFIQVAVFVDIFIGKPLDTSACTCTHSASSPSTTCSTCADVGGQLICQSGTDIGTFASDFGLYCSTDVLRGLTSTLVRAEHGRSSVEHGVPC